MRRHRRRHEFFPLGAGAVPRPRPAPGRADRWRKIFPWGTRRVKFLLNHKKRATHRVALFAVNSLTKKLPAVTSAATAATITTASTTAAAEVIALRHRLGFVDRPPASVQLRNVQAVDGPLTLPFRAHARR